MIQLIQSGIIISDVLCAKYGYDRVVKCGRIHGLSQYTRKVYGYQLSPIIERCPLQGLSTILCPIVTGEDVPIGNPLSSRKAWHGHLPTAPFADFHVNRDHHLLLNA
jgi:hypothetical protein